MSVNESKKTINEVVRKDRCYACGSCVAVCPTDAITITLNEARGILTPEINDVLCIQCGKCIKICPVSSTNVHEEGRALFPDANRSVLLGRWLESFYGWSKREEMQYNATSGGLVTESLLYLLDNKKVDGAIVVRMREDIPWMAEGFIAYAAEDVIDARGSKYCPVALNTVLTEVAKSEDKKRIAYVGLPCHIQGLRNLQKVMPVLNERVPFVFGIFCGHTPSYNATKEMLLAHDDSFETVTHIRYRGEGWPGKTKISNQTIDFKKTYATILAKKKHMPNACKYCTDLYAELADISFGDAWLPQFADNTKGVSVCTARSEKGKALIQDLATNNYISIEPLSLKGVLLSQTGRIFQKKTRLKERFALLKSIGAINYLRKYLFHIKRKMGA